MVTAKDQLKSKEARPAPEKKAKTWKEYGFRILVSPSSRWTGFIRIFKEILVDGRVVREPHDTPVVLVSQGERGKSLLGYMDYMEVERRDVYDPSNVEKLVNSDVVFTQAMEHREIKPDTEEIQRFKVHKRMPLYGSSKQISQEYAEECGMTLVELVEQIEGKSSYGKYIAFIDDQVAMSKIKHRFASFVEDRERDRGHVMDILAMNEQNQIGPELSQLEPATAPYVK